MPCPAVTPVRELQVVQPTRTSSMNDRCVPWSHPTHPTGPSKVPSRLELLVTIYSYQRACEVLQVLTVLGWVVSGQELGLCQIDNQLTAKADDLGELSTAKTMTSQYVEQAHKVILVGIG